MKIDRNKPYSNTEGRIATSLLHWAFVNSVMAPCHQYMVLASSVAVVKLYSGRSAITATDPRNDRVDLFFDEQNVSLLRVPM
jgi:hypothetical protein